MRVSPWSPAQSRGNNPICGRHKKQRCFSSSSPNSTSQSLQLYPSQYSLSPNSTHLSNHSHLCDIKMYFLKFSYMKKKRQSGLSEYAKFQNPYFKQPLHICPQPRYKYFRNIIMARKSWCPTQTKPLCLCASRMCTTHNADSQSSKSSRILKWQYSIC